MVIMRPIGIDILDAEYLGEGANETRFVDRE